MATAGKTSIGASEDFNAANDGAVNGPYTVGVGSTITEFHAYFRSDGVGPAITVRPLIYRDSAGEPGALIATLAEIALTTGDTAGAWRDLTGLSVVSPSAAIWIGLWNLNSNYRYAYDTPGGNPERYKGSLAAYSSSGDAPDPWPAASDSTSTQEPSMYVVYTSAVASQMLAPSADSVDGTWTDNSGGAVLAAAIDESAASDSDYIQSPTTPADDGCRVKLQGGTDPASSGGHIIRWRIRKDAAGGATINMTVKLRQGGGNSIGGGTLIASFARNNVDGSGWTTYAEELSGAQADTITDYSDLYLEFFADVP